VGHPHGPKAHHGTIITGRPDDMWGTDTTTTITLEEGQAYVFVGVYHCMFAMYGDPCLGVGESVSSHGAARGPSLFDDYTEKVAEGMAVRYDHSPAYMADDFRDGLKFPGIELSPSFGIDPKGNGCSERFIRLLKGESALSAHLCHHRRVAPGLDRLQAP